jgi:glycosyltransferase involved in cell wall biosynthesis
MGINSLVVVSPEYPPNILGGLGTHVHALTSALARNGINIQLLVPDNDNYRPRDSRIHIHTVPVSHAESLDDYWLRFASGAAAFARRLSGPIDVVHCHDWSTTLAGLALREALSAPLVLTIHLPQNGSPGVQFENLGLLSADAVIVNSKMVAGEVADRNLYSHPPAVIPNGVDLSIFRPPDPAARQAHTILFAGRLVEQKGVDVLLQAFRVLLSKIPSARLIIAGDGYQLLYLQRLCRYLGISDEVSFIGWQTGSSLIHLYQVARVVAMPSRYEPFGLVALEALACATPVIACETGGLAEIISDGVQGYLVPVDDHLRLAQRLAILLSDQAHADELGKAGRDRAAQFSWTRVAVQTQRLYEQTVRSTIPNQSASVSQRARLDEQIEAMGTSLRSAVREIVGPKCSI